MTAADADHAMLTALFAAGAARALRYGVRPGSSGWRRRVDHVLHTAMALAMAVMPWRSGPASPELPQTVFFAAAGLWFPLSAVARGRQSQLAAAVRRLPYTAGMVAMAWMTHRAAGPAHLGHAMGESRAGGVVTGALALYLLASALRWLTLGMPTLRTSSATTDHVSDTTDTYDHFWDGAMTLGTAIMLLMHH